LPKFPYLPQLHRGLHTWRHHIDSRPSSWISSLLALFRRDSHRRMLLSVNGWCQENSTMPR
jgi:hypothetical protein